MSDVLRKLANVLVEMDHDQISTDNSGGAEAAWYYWRDELIVAIEDALRLAPGELFALTTFSCDDGEDCHGDSQFQA